MPENARAEHGTTKAWTQKRERGDTCVMWLGGQQQQRPRAPEPGNDKEQHDTKEGTSATPTLGAHEVPGITTGEEMRAEQWRPAGAARECREKSNKHAR